MKKSIMLASVLAALSMPVAAQTDQPGECALQRPFKVLNAQTGGYEINRIRGERGWCNFSDQGIDNSVWAADGPQTADGSEGADAGDGGSSSGSGSDAK